MAWDAVSRKLLDGVERGFVRLDQVKPFLRPEGYVSAPPGIPPEHVALVESAWVARAEEELRGAHARSLEAPPGIPQRFVDFVSWAAAEKERETREASGWYSPRDLFGDSVAPLRSNSSDWREAASMRPAVKPLRFEAEWASEIPFAERRKITQASAPAPGRNGALPPGWSASGPPKPPVVLLLEKLFPPSRAPGDNPDIPNVRPDDIVTINGRALFGDGSPMEVDFGIVNLGDLDASLLKEAGKTNSRLRAAIDQAMATGKPVPIKLSDVSAGGGEGGKTRWQVGGIGRFAVTIDGVVRPTKDGGWTLESTVTGNRDRQDYPPDKRRGPIAGAVNDALRRVQDRTGGEDYDIIFFGSQKFTMSGTRK